MIKRVIVEFKSTLTLPRRSVKVGDKWEAMPHKFTSEGLLVGGGMAPYDSFDVIGFKVFNENKKHL